MKKVKIKRKLKIKHNRQHLTWNQKENMVLDPLEQVLLFLLAMISTPCFLQVASDMSIFTTTTKSTVSRVTFQTQKRKKRKRIKQKRVLPKMPNLLEMNNKRKVPKIKKVAANNRLTSNSQISLPFPWMIKRREKKAQLSLKKWKDQKGLLKAASFTLET